MPDRAATASVPPVQRLHWIDWLRVLAIAAVFTYHTFRPFNTDDWHVKNFDQSAALNIAMGVFWSFGLAVLFLLSGVGARFALRRRTWPAFLRERFTRLIVPFFVGGVLVLSPIQAYIEAVHNGTSGGPFVDFAPRWIGTALNPFNWSFSPMVFGRGYHLWFLGFLFAISAIALPLFVGLQSRRGRRAVDALARSLDWPGATLVFAVPIVVLMSIGVFLGTGEHDWFELCWYLAYFVIGFVLVSDDRFLAAVRRDGWVAVGTAVASTFVLTATPAADLLASIEGGLDLPHYLAGMLFGLEGWAWTLVILNVGMRVSAVQRPLAARLNEAVLPVYVIHQPVILAVALFVVQWPLGILPKWIAVFGVSAAITLVLVQLGLRFRVSRVLLGARAQPPGPVPAVERDPKTVEWAWPGARGAGGSHARPR